MPIDQGYGWEVPPFFAKGLEPVARVTLYVTGTKRLFLRDVCFGAARLTVALRVPGSRG